MKHLRFHLMPYRDLPADFEKHHESAWVGVPNQRFDPAKGHVFYNEYIDQLAEAETLGFTGVCVNEHHQSAYGLMPSPNLIAAMLVMRTSRIRIAVLSHALPLYDPPTRVAEEIAMLEVISGGRCSTFWIGARPGSSGSAPAATRPFCPVYLLTAVYVPSHSAPGGSATNASMRSAYTS